MAARSRNRTEGPRMGSHRLVLSNATTGEVTSDVTTENHHVAFSSVESMDDVVTPGFNRRSAAGEIINNPMLYIKDTVDSGSGGKYSAIKSGTEWTISAPKGSLSAQNADRPFWGVGRLETDQSPSDHLSAVKANCLGNVDRSPYAFAEDFGEVFETIRFLRQPFQGLKEVSERFSFFAANLTKNHRLDFAQAIARAWLEYRFAFSPLVRSAWDAALALSEPTPSSRPTRQTARSRSESFDSIQDTAMSGNGAFQYFRSLDYQGETRAGILYEVANPLVDWRHKYGFRFKDFPETAWALAPYSFLVDRIVNISEFIRGVTSFLDPNLKILAAWTTEKSEVSDTRNIIDAVSSGGWVRSIPEIGTGVTHTSVRYNRVPWDPGLSDTLPPFKVSGLIDSVSKVADLSSLILANLGK